MLLETEVEGEKDALSDHHSATNMSRHEDGWQRPDGGVFLSSVCCMFLMFVRRCVCVCVSGCVGLLHTPPPLIYHKWCEEAVCVAFQVCRSADCYTDDHVLSPL